MGRNRLSSGLEKLLRPHDFQRATDDLMMIMTIEINFLCIFQLPKTVQEILSSSNCEITSSVSITNLSRHFFLFNFNNFATSEQFTNKQKDYTINYTTNYTTFKH